MQVASRLLVASVFFASASLKSGNVSTFAKSLSDFDLVAPALTRPSAYFLIAAEFAIGFLLLLGKLLPWSILAAVALLLIFFAAILVSLVRGKFNLKCGCFGSGRKIGWSLLARNLGFSGLALASIPAGSGAIAVVCVVSVALLAVGLKH